MIRRACAILQFDLNIEVTQSAEESAAGTCHDIIIHGWRATQDHTWDMGARVLEGFKRRPKSIKSISNVVSRIVKVTIDNRTRMPCPIQHADEKSREVVDYLTKEMWKEEDRQQKEASNKQQRLHGKHRVPFKKLNHY